MNAHSSEGRHIDTVNFVLETAGAEITDIDSLARLMRDLGNIDRVPNYLTMAFASVKRLNVALKLPLGFCKALEHRLVAAHTECFQSTDKSMCGSDWNTQLNMWCQLNKGMRHLSGLRELHIWLDHDSKDDTWAIVNERAILFPFTILYSETQIHLTARLPILHPRCQTPDRHFMPDSPQSPFPIHRRTRQRLFGEMDDSGHLKVVYKTDFPMYSLGSVNEHDPIVRDLQDLERYCGETGQDPMDVLNGLRE